MLSTFIKDALYAAHAQILDWSKGKYQTTVLLRNSLTVPQVINIISIIFRPYYSNRVSSTVYDFSKGSWPMSALYNFKVLLCSLPPIPPASLGDKYGDTKWPFNPRRSLLVIASQLGQTWTIRWYNANR